MRPKNWPPSLEVGKTNKHSAQELKARSHELYDDFVLARTGHKPDTRVKKGSLSYIIARYKKSEHWLNLSPHTQRGYEPMLKVIADWCKASGHPHIKHMGTKEIVGFLNRWQDTPRTRKNYKSVLSKLFQVAIEENLVSDNLVRKITLPKSHKRKDTFKVWTLADIERFIKVADQIGKPNVGTAVAIAWEGFRQTDVFNLQEPRDYTNGFFRFKTSKTGEIIKVEVSRYDTIKRLSRRPKSQLLLTVNDSTQMQWGKLSFYHMFKEVREAADMHEYVFRHIRNSAAIYALKAGLNDAEFKQRFGWSKDQVQDMVDYYTDIDQEIIDSGAAKLRDFAEKSR